MMRSIAIFAFLTLMSSLLWSQNSDKVSAKVLHKMEQQGYADILVVFGEQFNGNDVRDKANKFEKGRTVHSELLQIARESQNNVRQYLDERGKAYRSFHIFNMINLLAGRELTEELATFPEVREIVYNSPVKVEEPAAVSSIQLRTVEWGISNIKADSVWSEYGFKGSGVVIGGQDTGYDWDHEALKSKYRGWDTNTMTVDHNYNWHDAIHMDNPLSGDPQSCGYDLTSPCDDNGHGTHTMGTMVGDDGGSNQIGVAPDAKWIGCRNMEEGYGSLTTYSECFEWFLAPYPVGDSTQNGDPTKAPHVINNSWGCPPMEGCDTSNFYIMDSIVNACRAAGIVVVASAGNSGSDGCESVDDPAAIFEGSFTVGATNSSDDIAGFSSRGPVTVDGSGRRKPNVSAPGVNVRSSIPDDLYNSFQGTSMAGPHVAGAVALLINANILLEGEVDSIEAILQRTARPRTSTQTCGSDTAGQVPNNVYGYGIIDALAAVEEAQTVLNVELISFFGIAQEGVNKLYWTTAGEMNNSHFIVQRSENGLDWQDIARIEGHGTTPLTQDYTYMDNSPFAGPNYYRLRQVDLDGSVDYSNTILLRQLEERTPFVLYPNPTGGKLFLHHPTISDLSGFELELYNMVGQRFTDRKITGMSVDLSLAPGVFYYRLKDRYGMEVQSGKVVVR